MESFKFLYRLKNKFLDLWYHKIFRIAILVNLIFLVVSIALNLTILRNNNDFLVYYTVGEVFINDINELYSRANYLWPFRYFPLSAILFIPFYLLGFELGFILFNIINFLLNILSSILLHKIISLVKNKDHEKDDKRVVLYISLFLMSLPNVFNYILGQINLYITLLVLLSLFLFVKYNSVKWDFVSSLLLGLSIIIKPITIFMIPFLLILNFDRKTRKFKGFLFRNVVRLSGALLPVSFNFFIFALYPQLLDGFITTNFTGSEPIILNHSFSLSKLVVNFCLFYNLPFNSLLILIILLLFFGILGFVIYVFRRKTENSIISGYGFGISIMLLVYFDSWPHHLLILTPILIILIFLLPRDSIITNKYLKPSFIFLSFFDLIFMGIWFGTKEFFPFNFLSTIFLIFIFLGIFKLSLTKNQDN